jgi:hypothetical protein
VTPGWISRADAGVFFRGLEVVGWSIGGGTIGSVGIVAVGGGGSGVVSSAPAVAANATKSTTEQGRTASVARRRMARV